MEGWSQGAWAGWGSENHRREGEEGKNENMEYGEMKGVERNSKR